MIMGKMVYYIACVAIVSSLIISGCVSAPQQATPSATSTPARSDEVTSQPKLPSNLPSGFPSNLPTGAYSLTARVCTQGYGCTDAYAGTITNTDIYEFSRALTTTLNQAASQCAGTGSSCTVQYSAFNGKSFTATMTITSCYGGNCASSTIEYIISKV